MKKLKLLLIYPSSLYALDWGMKMVVKTHMLSLFSFLRHRGIEVEVLDLENEIGKPKTEDRLEEFKTKTARFISQLSFDIAAISCWSSLDYLSSIMVADICKKVNGKSTVVVGGYHPSALSSDFMYQKSPFDFIIKGEGEMALLKICMGEETKNNKPKVIQGTPLELKDDFVLDWQNYRYSEPNRLRTIYLSRGCPFSCSFCMEQTKGNGRWRSYSVDLAVKKIKHLIDIENPGFIGITDASFGFDKTWRKEFLSALIKERIDKMFWAESRIDLFDEEDIDLLSKLNFNIEFGLESGSEEMLCIMKKTNRPKEYLKKCKAVITYMNEKEVPYKMYLIFNHPGETSLTYASTIQFLRSLIDGQSKISGILGGQNYAFFPGSHVHRNLKFYEQKYGTQVKHKEWWKQQQDHYELATSVIPSKDLMAKDGEPDYWKKERDDLMQQCSKKMPAWVRFFHEKKAETFKPVLQKERT